MKVLVTGGAGFIGSHTCKLLAKAGYTPVTIDNLTTGNERLVKWGPLVKGDIKDREVLRQVFQEYRPQAVLHFAALAYVGDSMKDPAAYYQNNVVGTLSLLESMREHQINSFVFSSTCAIYGIPSEATLSETHAKKPINPYGNSKWMVEQILEDYAQSYGLRSISLRYFNAAGSDPDCETGEIHDPEPHLIPIAIQVAQRKLPFITVNGTDFATRDGTAERDYVHVMDLAEAHVKALKQVGVGLKRRAFNLGIGHGATVKEVIQEVARVTGVDVPIQHGPRRPGDPPVLVCDPGLAREELDWTPRYPMLASQIQHAWKWFQNSNSR